MLQQLALNYAAGQVLWAYHTLMLTAFLLDPFITGALPGPDPSMDPNSPTKAALGLAGLPQLLDLVIDHERQVAAQKVPSSNSSDSDPDSDSDTRPSSGSDLEPRHGKHATLLGGGLEESGLGPKVTSPAASVGPLLIRMQSGEAASLTGMAEELQSLQWLLERLQADPAFTAEVCLLSRRHCADPQQQSRAAC